MRLRPSPIARPSLRLLIRRPGIPLFPALAVGCALSVLLLSACGEDDNDVASGPTVDVPQDTAPAPSLQLQPQPEPAQQLDERASTPADGIMELSAADTSFAPNRWRMALGDTVVIRLTNADTQQHNLRLAGLDGEFDTDDDALTSPDPVGAGEAGELTFVPQASGNYTFRCDYHPASMGGRIEVE